jgi:hypothetical protein
MPIMVARWFSYRLQTQKICSSVCCPSPHSHSATSGVGRVVCCYLVFVACNVSILGCVYPCLCHSFAFFYFFFLIIGVGLCPLGSAATSGLLYQPQMIDEGDCGAIGGMKIGRGNRSTRRKPAPAPLCPPQIPHDQTRARTRAAVVGSQRLTA